MIRPYRETDVEDLLEVWERASRLAHPFLSEDFMEKERADIRNAYLPVAETWVWEEDGRVVGFMSLLGNEVAGLFVLPSRHRSGIGRAFIDHARDLRGELEVEVFKENAIGRAFYSRCGFTPLREIVNAATGLPALRLRLS